MKRYSEGLSFSDRANGTCAVSGIGSCEDTELVIPPVTPDNKRVTEILEYAFEDCDFLTSVIIPEGVMSIGMGAFWGCSGLTSIEIPDGVTSIESNAFCDCSSLTSVEIPASVTELGRNPFGVRSGLVSITVDEKTQNITVGITV